MNGAARKKLPPPLLMGASAALLLLAVPLGFWLSGGSAYLRLIPGLALLVLAAPVQIGLWEASGGLCELIEGQLPPSPRQLQRDISLRGGEKDPDAVEVEVDLSQPLATVSPQYLSFALDLSQVVGGKWRDPRADRIELGSGSVQAPVFDFGCPELDLLTRALAPAYLRNGLELVFTLNAGPSSRDRRRCWSGDNAAELLSYSASRGYPVSVWELGNEMNAFWAPYSLGGQVPVEQYHGDLAAAGR
jgi:hypothetical protein